MLINGINISNFKARLMDRDVGSAEFNIENDWSTSSLNPFICDRFGYKYKTLAFTLDIVCNSSNEIEIMKSNLIKQLTIATIKFDDIDYYYRGFIVDKPTFKYIMKGNETLEVNMLVIAEKDQVAEVMNGVSTKTINVNGNTDTPSVVEITPSIDIIDIVINGVSDAPMIIKNLKAGKKIIINGEDGTVLENGINKFNDTEMWEFPRLRSGSNTITLSRSNADITIKYKPRYI